MKASDDKYQHLGTSWRDITATVEDFNTKNCNEEKLLVIKLNTMFLFESYISSLCKKAS